MEKMRRGLFRLWLVAAGFWLLFSFWGVDTFSAWSQMTHQIDQLAVASPYILGIPVVLLGVGAAIVWAVEGFKQ